MFKGSNVALVTPFKNDKLDDDTYIKLIHFHIKNGTNGLVPAGTTGESPNLSIKDREIIYSTAIDSVSNKAKIIAIRPLTMKASESPLNFKNISPSLLVSSTTSHT